MRGGHGEDKEEEGKGVTWLRRLHVERWPQSTHLGWNLIAFIQRALQETQQSHAGVRSISLTPQPSHSNSVYIIHRV